MISEVVYGKGYHCTNFKRQCLVFCDVPNFWRAAGHHRYILFVNEIWFVAMNTKAHLSFPKMCEISFLFSFVVSIRICFFSLVVTAIL